MEKIVTILSNEKKWRFTHEAPPKTVSEYVRRLSSQGLWETLTLAMKAVIKEGWDYLSSKLSTLEGKLFSWW